jgi:hypothetical protein
MYVKNRPLVDLAGKSIMSGDVPMTVANVLVNCALAPTANGQPRPQTEVASRYDLALRLNGLAEGEQIDIAPEMIVKLKEDMLRIYATIIAGQMLPILDGHASH